MSVHAAQLHSLSPWGLRILSGVCAHGHAASCQRCFPCQGCGACHLTILSSHPWGMAQCTRQPRQEPALKGWTGWGMRVRIQHPPPIPPFPRLDWQVSISPYNPVNLDGAHAAETSGFPFNQEPKWGISVFPFVHHSLASCRLHAMISSPASSLPGGRGSGITSYFVHGMRPLPGCLGSPPLCW